jgi:hypothetical protein
MNKGINVAKGEYCLFLNSGDWLVDKKILKEVFVDFPNKDIVYGNLHSTKGGFTYSEKLTFSTFFWGSIGHPSSFIRKKLFENYGNYNENNKIISDWEFFITTIIQNNCTYKYIDKTITFFELDGISSDKKTVNIHKEERERVLKESFPLMYDDYIEMNNLKKELRSYKNSRIIRFVKKIQLIIRNI